MSHTHEPGVRCAQCELRESGYQALAGELDSLERRCLQNIEKHYCQIWNVDPSDGDNVPPDDGFSYSVGIYSKLRAPELIIFGQKPEWRSATINAIVERIAGGERFEAGRTYRGLLDNYELSFHRMPLAAYPEYLGWDIWYYDRFFPQLGLFPVLQVVWPDLDGRFPWEPGYDNYKQPVLEHYEWTVDEAGVRARPRS
jgi:hypothetical protein